MSESIGNFKDPKIVAVIKKLQDMAKALSMSDNKHSIEQLLEAITLKAFTESWNLAMERASEIAEKHVCGWDTGCIDEDGNGDGIQTGYCNQSIANAINKEKV